MLCTRPGADYLVKRGIEVVSHSIVLPLLYCGADSICGNGKKMENAQILKK
jgi:hypothetical protein